MYKIMLVDDEENILKSLSRTLHHAKDWDIETYTSPAEALKRIHCCIFDVVISDHNMPEQNGVEFLSEIKEIQPDTMRILLTGIVNNEVLLGALNKASVFRFITKPWNDKLLIETIEDAVKYRSIIIENKMLASKVREQNEQIAALKNLSTSFTLTNTSMPLNHR